MEKDVKKLPQTKIDSKAIMPEYVQPSQSADTLFNFMTQLDHLQKTIETKMLSPRYCVENTKYLGIKGLNKVAIPMRCFCDINIHKLGEHISWYGGYAIGFSKEYGISKGIQPVTYINDRSMLAKDFKTAFNAALKTVDDSKYKSDKQVRNYLLNQLLFVKPIEGKTFNHTKNKYIMKCLTDEQEWRYVPTEKQMSSLSMKQVIIDEAEMDRSVLLLESNALDGVEECSLAFEYSDIKYIIILDASELIDLCNTIVSLPIGDEEKKVLLTKIIVWNTWKGDL